MIAKNAEHPTTKTERQMGEETRNLAAAEKRLNEAAEFAKDGDVLPAAASLFVEHPREVIYLFSGSVEQYKPFYASALIQHDAMLHFCVEHGLSRYNFYGIDGVFYDNEAEAPNNGGCNNEQLVDQSGEFFFHRDSFVILAAATPRFLCLLYELRR